MSESQVDYIIAGGGTAACVLAARLSEDPQVQVMLLEAGGPANDPRFKVPAGVSMVLGNKHFDWRYPYTANASINGRNLDGAAGRVLGGGSSVNGMVYIRGDARDYDSWSEHCRGQGGWGWQDLLPYFKRAENFVDRGAEHLGKDGPISVSAVSDRNPVAEAFIEAGLKTGQSRGDFNSGLLEGFGPAEGSINRGRRASTYEAYLRPALSRKNLTVLTSAQIDKLLIENGRVVGVSALLKGEQRQFRARREVLLSAGAVGSPAILLRSGIGPAEVLADLGVQPVLELSGVGENFQEHIGCGISKYVSETTINSQMGPIAGLKHLWRYLVHRKGLLASPVVQSMAYIRTEPGLAKADVQLALVPFAYIVQPDSSNALTAYTPKEDGVMVSAFIANPESRGRIKLKSVDPQSKPEIDYDFFARDRDLEKLVKACKQLQALYATEPLANMVTGDCSLETLPQNDDQWREYIRASAIPCYHFAGTCQMGVDERAVVDPQLCLRGLRGLRVVDASVMPTVPSSNTYASVVAIAEKAADLIKDSARGSSQ